MHDPQRGGTPDPTLALDVAVGGSGVNHTTEKVKPGCIYLINVTGHLCLCVRICTRLYLLF